MRGCVLLCAAFVLHGAGDARAQELPRVTRTAALTVAASVASRTETTAAADSGLPEDPALSRRPDPSGGGWRWFEAVIPGGKEAPAMASRRAQLVRPGQSAPELSVGDKVEMGFEHAFSPLAITGWFASAGFGQLTDGYPKYGVDRGAFGMRLGTGALRDSSEAIFSDSVAAPILHQDPRYYRIGLEKPILRRIGYAALRPLVGRTDSGHHTVNLALMLGTLAGSALTNAYYPANSTGPGTTFETFGWSMEGSVIGDLIREFYGDAGQLIEQHRERQQAGPPK